MMHQTATAADTSILVLGKEPAELATYLRLATGLTVDTVTDVKRLAHALSDQPTAVICDVDALEGYGHRAVTEIRHRSPSKPLLIALSERADLSNQLFELGFDRYYVRPFSMESIEMAIRLHELELLVSSH